MDSTNRFFERLAPYRTTETSDDLDDPFCADTPTTILLGDTYEHRAEIKSAGYRWDGNSWERKSHAASDDEIALWRKRGVIVVIYQPITRAEIAGIVADLVPEDRRDEIPALVERIVEADPEFSDLRTIAADYGWYSEVQPFRQVHHAALAIRRDAIHRATRRDDDPFSIANRKLVAELRGDAQ